MSDKSIRHPSNDSQNRDTLERVLDGVDLTEDERKSLDWLASWERSTVENIARVILKARDAQVRAIFNAFEEDGKAMVEAERKAEAESQKAGEP